jgi:hypothetical protein
MAERTQDYDEERLHQASPLMLGRADVGREVTARDREAIYGAYDLEISLAWRKNLSGGKARGLDPVASAIASDAKGGLERRDEEGLLWDGGSQAKDSQGPTREN